MYEFKLNNLDGCVYELVNGSWIRWGDYGLWLSIYNDVSLLEE